MSLINPSTDYHFWCRHPDCGPRRRSRWHYEGPIYGPFESIYHRNVHMEEVHRIERDEIRDPDQLWKEIIKLKGKLNNQKWRGGQNKTFTILYTNPKRKKVEDMRKTLLKEIYDLQEDFEWICHSYYMLYYSGDPSSPGKYFPSEIFNLSRNNSMFWNFSADALTKTVWLDLVVSPLHPNTTNVSKGFCYAMVGEGTMHLDIGNEEEARTCFDKLLEYMGEAYDQLEILNDIYRIRQRLNFALGLQTSGGWGSAPTGSTFDYLGGFDPWDDLLSGKISQKQEHDDFIRRWADEGIYFSPRSYPKFGGKKKLIKKKKSKRKLIYK